MLKNDQKRNLQKNLKIYFEQCHLLPIQLLYQIFHSNMMAETYQILIRFSIFGIKNKGQKFKNLEQYLYLFLFLLLLMYRW